MYIPEQMVRGWELRYITPVVWHHHQEITDGDYEGIHASQKRGRAHDITLYIEHDGLLAVIAKPIYPPGLYRAPSGGLDPGEELEIGAMREAIEETGLDVQLHSYLLRAHVVFAAPCGSIAWTTHVFTATTEAATLAPTDHHEIREARWAAPSEFVNYSEIMRGADRGGLRYRAALHDQIAHLHPLFQQNSPLKQGS